MVALTLVVMKLSSKYSAALALLAASGLSGVNAVSFFAFWTKPSISANIIVRLILILVMVLSCLIFVISLKIQIINAFIDRHH